MSFAAAQYKAAGVETASPVQIVVQLYDGAVRFTRQGHAALEEGRRADAATALQRAHAIVSELQASLDHSHAPELCEDLSSLYDFALHRLREATAKSAPALLEAVVSVLSELREAWAELARRGL